MTDKELLELAARAAGVKLVCYGGISYYASDYMPTSESWDPLADDGDAMRLAVKLDMTVNIQGKWVMVDCGDMTKRDYDDNDTFSATRRAIVRAAAAIGEKL